MINKIKNLNTGMKILVGIIAVMFLPITLIVLSVNLAVDGFKNRNKVKKVIGLVCAFLCTAFVIGLYSTSDSSKQSVSNNKLKIEDIKETGETKEEKNANVVDKQKDEQDDKAIIKDENKEEKVAQEKKESTNEEEKNVSNQDKQLENPFGAVMKKPVMNGFKTERIGTYAEVMTGGIEINKDNLLAFYKSVVKGSEYNWVTLNINNKLGIQFPGSDEFFSYGEIDDEGCITRKIGYGSIFGNTIEYDTVDYDTL